MDPNRLKYMMESIPAGVIGLSTDGIMTDLNAAALRMLGADSPEQVIGKSFASFVQHDHRETVYALLEQALQGGIDSLEYELIGSNGAHCWIGADAAPLRDSTGTVSGSVQVIRDITDQRKRETHLRYTQKMDAISTLTGGIAHDFNNMLTAVIGYANIVRMKLKQDDPLRPLIEQVLVSSERATSLTQSLLTFSRRVISNQRPISLNETMTRVEKLLRQMTGDRIELTLDLSGRDATIMADSGQIEQVLMNLVSNAGDAMPDGGTLSIATGSTEMDEPFIREHGFGRPSAYATITVRDTGIGMDEKTLSRIFEPFFTTKDVGKGMGLGLPIVWGIIKQHGGFINCASEVDRGTVVTMYLPVTGASPSVIGPESVPIPRGGSETILIADDDPEVRRVLSTFLRDFGYTILEADSGESAVAVFRENRDAVDLLLFDVVMPKMSGKRSYDEIVGLRPGIKVLFMSSYGAHTMAQHGISRDEFPVIAKPISPDALFRKVREVLDT